MVVISHFIGMVIALLFTWLVDHLMRKHQLRQETTNDDII